MVDEYWVNLVLAIFGLVLYTGDTSLDFIVAIELFKRCHYRLASFMMSFMIAPGFMLGFLTICAWAFDDGLSPKNFLVITSPLVGLFAGLLFIPVGFAMIIWSVIKIDSTGREDTSIS